MSTSDSLGPLIELGIEAGADTDAVGRAHLLAEVERGLFGDRAPTVRVGRYRMIERLGGGAQGVVWIAHDPRLHRRVAVKVLRTEGIRHPDAHLRLLREASTLARLSHPNVVSINDVGECEIGVYVVTELVQGVTLGAWLKNRRPWREVLSMFVGAGQGLVAAHAQGIVHRDFKPANVLVGSDGRARLLDFGLARDADRIDSSDADAPPAATSGGGLSSSTLTVPGNAMGTPAYMAPEQHAGTPADGAADQFAFCVALYEGLWGRRPFDQSTVAELAAAKHRGVVPVPARGEGAPRAIFEVVRRGLAPRPRDRFASMAELLASLERVAGQPKRRLGLTVGLGSIATASALGWLATVSPDPPEAAAPPTASDRSGEAAVSEPPPAIAAEVAALRQRIAVGRTFASGGRFAEAEPILRAATADAATLHYVPVEVEAKIAHGMVLRSTSEWDAAEVRLESAYLDAEASELPALSLQAARELANLHGGQRGDPDAGRDWLRRAEAALERLGARADPIERGLLARAAADVAERSGDHATALEQARQARDILAAELPPDDPRIVYGHTAIARTLTFMNRLDEARVEGERALALAERISGPDHTDTAQVLNVLALVAKRRGDFEASLRLQLRNLAIREASVGPDDPSVAGVLGNIAVLQSEMGQAAEAEATYRRALAIQREHLGADDPIVARTLHNLAITVRDRGRLEEAFSLWREALSIGAASMGSEHPEVAAYEFMYGAVLAGSGRVPEALPLLQHALEVARTSLGEDHPTTAERLSGLADAQRRLGQIEEAGKNIRRALEITVAALGPDHVAVGRLHHLVGRQLEAEGQLEEALAMHQRSLGILEASLGPEHTAVAEVLAAAALLHTSLGHPDEGAPLMARAEAINAAAHAAAAPP